MATLEEVGYGILAVLTIACYIYLAYAWALEIKGWIQKLRNKVVGV